MKAAKPSISLFVSDIDGTLLTPDKRLTPATIAAVHSLEEQGLPFALASSRPPQGFRMLIEPLRLTLPFAAFNGGMIADPRGQCLAIDLLPEACAQESIATILAQDLEAWLFTQDKWYVLDDKGAYVAHEQRAIGVDPIIVADFSGLFGQAAKIVGSSRDFTRVAACETILEANLAGKANAHRSQDYYVDVTPRDADKGHAVEKLAAYCNVPLSEVAVIGDMANDLAMFAKAGFAIAMGNATEAVKAKADVVAADNRHEGFASAVEMFILPRLKRRAAR